MARCHANGGRRPVAFRPKKNGTETLWFLVGFTATSGRDENAGAYHISRMLRRDWAGALIGLLPFIVASSRHRRSLPQTLSMRIQI
jgi:hypothetical protein